LCVIFDLMEATHLRLDFSAIQIFFTEVK